ncbi:MAG: phage holin family protein [Verrucomicrobiota bacterium]
MSQKLLQSFGRVAGLRWQIFVEELRLEKMRLIGAAWVLALGFACLQIFFTTLLCLVMVLTEGNVRVWSLGILGGLALLGAVTGLLVSLKAAKSREAPFRTTAAEFRKDQECLESVLRS